MEITVLEHGIDEDTCLSNLLVDETVYGLHLLRPSYFTLKLREIIVERSSVSRNDLVHPYDLVVGLSNHKVFLLVLAAVVVGGLDRFGNLPFLEVFDRPIVLRL